MDDFPTLPPGTLIAGKLRLVRMLGAGGMGVVYEVEHEITKHRRALKVLHAYAAEQPGVVERFLREASAAGRVGNAHVAETFDAGTLESGEPYLLMELLDGETLDQLLQRVGPLDPGHLCDLIHQACEGVQAAHDAGIIHRDLKPENLMIVTRDRAPFVKILDFGISKFDTERTGSMKLTTEGLVMGTPYYMSPEQVRGSSTIDARTDIYALGVILYECATGVRPFEAQTVQHLAVLIHEGKPMPLASRRASMPSSFYEIVNRAMAADREQRFENAKALARALAPLRTRISSPPSTRIMEAPQIVIDALSGGGPRVSSRPAGPMPATDGALSATMAPGVASGDRRARAVGVSAVVLLLAAGAVAVAVVFSRSTRLASGSTPVAASALEPAQVAAQLPPATALAPPVVPAEAPVAQPSASAASQPPAATEPTRRPATVAGATPSARLAPSAAATVVAAPPPAPPQRPRVEENGLSRENPFR